MYRIINKWKQIVVKTYEVLNSKWSVLLLQATQMCTTVRSLRVATDLPSHTGHIYVHPYIPHPYMTVAKKWSQRLMFLINLCPSLGFARVNNP